MTSNEADGPEFTLLGSYLPQDAQKLLERLDRTGIAFRTRTTMPFPQPGPSATLLISVDSARSSEANQILRDLFGDNLPNYDSSFFVANITSNQSMKPTAPSQNTFGVIATAPFRGLSLSR
jgi:hypothetical protein